MLNSRDILPKDTSHVTYLIVSKKKKFLYFFLIYAIFSLMPRDSSGNVSVVERVTKIIDNIET